MSTRSTCQDQLQRVALVACSRRELLLRTHRRWLSREDLEDCYSQATLELLLGARRGRAFACERHIANTLHQRFVSRIRDRRRALKGRSSIESALASALPLGRREHDELEPADVRADVEQLVQVRHQLRLLCEAAARLSADQRLVLGSQLRGEQSPRELCRSEGWSAEKYRKVAQRARARLRSFVECPVSRGHVG